MAKPTSRRDRICTSAVALRVLDLMVGERGFEPPTPWSRTRCSTRLSHSPNLRLEGCRGSKGSWLNPCKCSRTTPKCIRRRVSLCMTPRQQLDLTGLHVLDGGLATELEQRGFDLNSPLWSAQVLQDSPDAIVAVHRDYLEAGADCLLTASYQVSAEGFQKIGYSPQAAAEAAARPLRASVVLAEKARSEYQASTPRKIWIAASLGPYGAML